MYPISPHFLTFHQFFFISQPLCPACSYDFLIQVMFGQGDEQRIVPSFTFHKPAVKLPHVFIVQAFTQALETLTTAGFYQRHDKHLIQKTI